MFKSIANKLTLILVLLMGILLLFSMVFMSYSFESFYTRTKKQALEENLRTFRSQTIDTNEALVMAINGFETENNTRLFIFGQNGQLQYMAHGGTQLDGDYVEIIQKFFQDLLRDPSLSSKLLEEEAIVTREYARRDGTIHYFLTASAVNIGNYHSYAISIGSMVPINESARTIKNFFGYVFFGGFLVVAVLSYATSVTVTKPLRKLIAAAKELATFNFSVDLPKGKKDEIGDLSSSLATLSRNLQSALEELKEKNQLLEADLQKRKQLETQRKDFIRDISHELKTPITLIEGYAEGLLDGINEEAQEEYLTIILDEAKNMETMVKDMLELTYTESEAFTLHLEKVHLSKLVQKSVEPFLDYHGQKLTFHMEMEKEVWVMVDVVKFTTVLRNILKNAISYTDLTEEASLKITLKEAPGQMVLSFLNSPAHMPEEDLEKVWIQFYKRDASRNRKAGSSGLGLSIVRNILEKHELNFDLKNHGNGVLFEIRFQHYELMSNDEA
ncbi:MAG TPA: hypothetical protein DEA52_03495 [Clostridiaceae bacterium]|nr:hypothetical protein [Clostridiaceae bacterium]